MGVINFAWKKAHTTLRISSCFVVLFCVANYVSAAVLPEDRADVLLHNYDGDDSTFKGPSVLVRKQFKETVSLWGNYYVDMNSAASIDVVTQGSAYEEERTETSAGFDYLHDKTVFSASFTNSSENDYEANSYALSLSQDFFGDLSTLSMSYSSGEDDVYQNTRNGSGKDDITGRILQGNAEHQRFGIGWTQVLTKNWIVALNAEASVDEGFLRNPYRSVRFIGRVTGDVIEEQRQQENYPTTRNSEAYALKSMYYMPWRGALKLEYRTFSDSWDIEASNYEFRYTHPFGEKWIVDFRYRFYEQTQASFYSDLFNFRDEFLFRASDKELSTFDNTTIGFGLSYELKKEWIGWFDRATVNLFFDHVDYSYDNFRNKRLSQPGSGADGGRAFQPGSEPLFEFDAQITRIFVSLWY
ncbi:DUF3570 domain-containing protein [Agarilytica rhodophyticola]|uniref:DUF3570 domain-containing protein n=1 Tax=Agarilytica rhodophyticola TaxID=1737490 RepID=UPI001FE76827|nr:DUF3570 domain-containing protein [Agarilytica rhodophyticola]